MRKLLILIFMLFGCSNNENTQTEINIDDINLFVIDSVDDLWTRLWAEEFVGINNEIVSIGKICNAYPENGLHFDIFILCKSLLFDFGLKYLNDDDIYASDTQAIEDIFTESKVLIEIIRELDYTNETFLDFIEIIHDNLFAQDYLKSKIIDLNYLKDTINMISVDGDDFFMARENDILGKIYDTENDYDKAIYHTKQAIEYYERHHKGIHRDTLSTKLILATHYFDTDKIKEAKNVLNDVISNSEFESFPGIHLLAWSSLGQIEVYHGNHTDEFIIRKIFFERYFYAVKTLDVWDAEIDNIYLEDFAINLDFLDCESSFKSIKEFEDIKIIREKKYGDDFINIAWFDIEMQILKSNMLCSESNSESNRLQNLMRIKLGERLENLYDPYEIYQFAIYLQTLDIEKEGIKELHKKFTLKTQSIMLEIFDGIQKGELENPFSQFLADTVVYPLVFNLNILDKEIASMNLFYVEKILNGYFNNNNKEEGELMTMAYQALRNEVTSILIEQNFIQEAIRYGSLFDDYEKDIKKIEDIKIFRDEELLSQSKILVNAHTWNSKCKKVNCDLNINNILNSINSYSIDPIFLALYLEKNSQIDILNYINNEFLLLDKKNKYLQEDTSYYNNKKTYDSEIESILLNSFNDFSALPVSELNKIQEFIYPKLDIKNIQFNLNNDSLIVSVTSIPLRNNVLSVIVFISKEHVDIKIINDSYENDIASLFSNLNTIVEDVNNITQIDKVKNLSETISGKIFNEKIHNLKNKKNIFFTSNFHDAFNPNMLSLNEEWIVSNYDIGYFLKWSDFNDKIEDTNINNNPKSYIGFGNVDYSSHANFYSGLEETKAELTNSSSFFKKSRNYLGQQVTEKNIYLKGKNNSVVHFATHNTSINKYGLSNIPALVISKNSSNDGYLDAFEIQKIDLSNSDIILSACSTLYAKNDSDNFSKLIRAFKISGSRSIMATRWDIESQSAVLVSSSYAENLSNGDYPHASLSKIQRDLILSEKYNHPVFWAAYMTIMN